MKGLKTMVDSLANRINQPHYLMQELKKVFVAGMKSDAAKDYWYAKYQQEGEKFLKEVHPFKDLPDEQKSALINKTAGECCEILMNLMYSCGIENFIEQMVTNEYDGKEFVLSFQTYHEFKKRFLLKN